MRAPATARYARLRAVHFTQARPSTRTSSAVLLFTGVGPHPHASGRAALRRGCPLTLGPQALFTPDIFLRCAWGPTPMRAPATARYTRLRAVHFTQAPFTPGLKRISPRTSCAFHAGPRVLLTPDLECFPVRTSSALHPGPRAPFTPDLERLSPRTSCAFQSGPQARFTPDLKCRRLLSVHHERPERVAGADDEVLAAVHFVGDRSVADGGVEARVPQRVTGRRVQGDDVLRKVRRRTAGCRPC